MMMIAALSLFSLLVLAAVVATAVVMSGDGYGRPRGPDGGDHGVPDADGLPWTPYRDVSGARWPW